jgi:tetratricopeptide (TPR) repeat protein
MRLMGGRGGLSSVTGSDHPNPARRPPAAATTSTELSRAEALRGLAGTLKDVSSVTGSRQTLRRHLLAASDAERAGDLKTGLNAARLANALAPDDLEVQEVLGRLERARSVEEAPMFEKRALAEEKAGQWSQAALSWLRVVQGRPQDPVSARHCANALLEANLDLKTARDLAVRAMEADPSLVAARTLLARIYVAAGMHSNARRELDAATKLDPGNEIVKNLLRELG